MDLNTPNVDVAITVSESDETRVNAADVRVTVAETGRLLGGFVFNIGGSRLTIADGGVVQRGSGVFATPEIAIAGSPGADTVINNGAINARVVMGDGNDWFQTTRGISHLVEMGAGDDLVTVLGDNISQVNLDGGSGFDWLQITNSAFSASGQLAAQNFEGLRLDGASVGSNITGLRITSIYNISGLQQIEILGDSNADISLNGPQFYIRNSANSSANVSMAGKAALYLDGSQVRSIAGDSGSNAVILWNNGSVAEGIDLGGGDDFLSMDWQSTNVSAAGSLGASISGGAGQDQAYFRLVNGGNASLNFAAITGFETVLLQGAATVASTFNVTGLSDQTWLRIYGQSSVIITATTATGLVVDLAPGSLMLTAGSTIMRVGPESGSYSNPNANPALSGSVINAGTILGTVRFEEGDDTYDGRTGSVGGMVEGMAGNDTLLGGAGAETFHGGLGADRLEGNGGADVLFGEEGGDILLGGDGNDQLFGGAGGDQIDGGAGFDFASYTTAQGGILADLVVWSLNSGEAAGDSYAGIEGLVGTGFADSLRGTGGDNWLYGEGGSDVAFGRGGNDVLLGGAGDDTLYGNEGNDALYGGDGLDRLLGGSGADYLNGEDGFDFAHYDDAASGVTVDLLANAANGGAAAGDLLFNIEGLVGTAFGDNLLGGEDSNWLYGNAGQDLLFGRGGNDVLIAGSGDDQLDGGAGADQLYGEAGLDFARYDSAASGLVADLIVWGNNTGEAAGDSYSGIEGLVGTAFADSLRGDAAANYIYGEQGNDWLYGRDGDDTLLGGSGNDFLFGNAGRDLLFGGAGDDRFFFGAGDGTDVIADFEGGAGAVIDVIHLYAGLGVSSFAQLQSRMAQVGSDTIIAFDGGATLVLVGVAATSLLADDFVFG